MKKMGSLILCALMLLSLSLNPAMVQAAGTPAIVCENVTCAPGGQATVNVMIVDNPGFCYLEVTPQYASELTLEEVTNGNMISDFTKDRQYIWAADEDVTEDGLLVSMTFAAPEVLGQYEVSFIVRTCGNYNEQSVAFSVVSGIVTVGDPKPTDIEEFGHEVSGGNIVINEYLGNETYVKIGETYEVNGVEYPVTEIAPEAFYGNEYIEKLELPNTVTTIGEEAFMNCDALTELVLPESVELVEDKAFYGCTELLNVIVLNEDAEIGNMALGYYKKSTSNRVVADFVLEGHAGSTAEEYALDCDIEFKPLLRVYSNSVTLTDKLSMNYKIKEAVFEEYGYDKETLTVELELNGETYTLSEGNSGSGMAVFPFKNLSPDMMNDLVTATITAEYKGEQKVYVDEYSVATYCYEMLDEYADDENMRTLLVDMLNYGSAAQVYNDHNTDNLANSELRKKQKEWASPDADLSKTDLNTKVAVVQNAKATWKGAGLVLNDGVTLRLKLAATSVSGLSVKVTSESGDSWTIKNFVKYDDGQYYVYFNGLHAGQMREKLYLTVYEGTTAVSNTVSYSIASYANAKQDSTYPGLADLVMTMMQYGDSASKFN